LIRRSVLYRYRTDCPSRHALEHIVTSEGDRGGAERLHRLPTDQQIHRSRQRHALTPDLDFACKKSRAQHRGDGPNTTIYKNGQQQRRGETAVIGPLNRRWLVAEQPCRCSLDSSPRHPSDTPPRDHAPRTSESDPGASKTKHRKINRKGNGNGRARRCLLVPRF
jgi:hypothetical protein